MAFSPAWRRGPGGLAERGAGSPAHIVLVGMMGVGKTTTGQALAERRGWRFVDSDRQVEARTGRTVAQIWADEGERGFRSLESEVLAEALSAAEPSVVAAAGGTVVDPANRARMRDAGPIVWLRASPGTLATRVGPGADRPLLGSDPLAVLTRLSEERGPLYEDVADVIIDVEDMVLADVVKGVEDGVGDAPAREGAGLETGARAAGSGVASMSRVPVRLGERSYDVLVGRGARHRLGAALPGGAGRAAVVTQASVGVDVDAGLEQKTFVMPEGEEAKSLSTVEELCRQLARWGLTRNDVIVAVGGGVVTDTAGLVAALYHRGLPIVHLPTTLLGQVDAAIGGKTGVNLPEGKNLVGAFWQPTAVICDTEVLESLPEREYRSGLGEMAKYAFLGVDNLADLSIEEAVAACVRCKAEAVEADEHDRSGRRALLNYGHTLAHALETAGRYDLRHGEAVAIGLVYAAELALVLGRIDHARVEGHRALVRGYGLPDRMPAMYADTELLLGLLARDKKAVDGLTFVLDGPAGLEVVTGVSGRDAERALAAVS